MQSFLSFKHIVNNEKGGVLIITLLLLVVLTIIGIAANNTSITEILISNATKNKQAAFYAAEAGLEHGKLLILNQSQGTIGDAGMPLDWSFLFGGDSPYADAADFPHNNAKVILKDQAFGNYTYTVSIYDDNIASCNCTGAECVNASGDPCADWDGVVWMRSTSNSDIFGSASVEISLLGTYLPPTDLKIKSDYTAQVGGGDSKTNTGKDTGAMSAGEMDTGRMNRDA